MKKYHVTYFYLATGMEGRPDEEDYGIVEAESPEEAKNIIGRREYPEGSIFKHNPYHARQFFIGCLKAEELTTNFYDEHRTPPGGLCLFWLVVILLWAAFLVWGGIRLFS